MATVTKFVDTDAFSTASFNNKIDEINTALLSAGKSAFATIGTSVSEKSLVYTAEDCDYYCGANPVENATIIQKAMDENDCICFLSGDYYISKPITVEGKTVVGNRNAFICQSEINWSGDFLFKTSDFVNKKNYIDSLGFVISSTDVGSISFFCDTIVTHCHFGGGAYGVCGDFPLRVENCYFSQVKKCVSGRTGVIIINNIASDFDIFVMDATIQVGQIGSFSIQGNVAESSNDNSYIISPSANGGNMGYVTIFGNRFQATNFIASAGSKTPYNFTIVGNDLSFDSKQTLTTRKTLVACNNINYSGGMNVPSDSLNVNNL